MISRHQVGRERGYVAAEEPQKTHGLSRRNLLGYGLVGLGTAAVGIASPVLTGTALASGDQPGWYWCFHCCGLWYGSNGGNDCPSPLSEPSGQHSTFDTYNYALSWGLGAVSGYQPSWSWCHLCSGLFYGPKQSASHCPGNLSGQGNHNNSGSDNYSLYHGSSPGGMQTGWYWCGNCQGLFNPAPAGTSSCPAQDGVGPHVAGGSSFNYALVHLT